MDPHAPKTDLRTHVVRNQVPEWTGVSLFQSDPLLARLVSESAGSGALEDVAKFGAALGLAETWEWARQANVHRPELLRFDRSGHRLDEVRYHPAYHQLMALACEAGAPSIAWRAEQGGHQIHAALEYMLCQVEPGVCCPVTMSCLLYTSPSPRDVEESRMPSSA